jgi:hypothetical protein
VATQRLMLATLSGQTAYAVATQFQHWRSNPDPEALDRFCSSIREHSSSLPVIYFTEWVDRWLMGDAVPGPGALDGRRFSVTCLNPSQAVAWADRCGGSAEEGWLSSRLREAATAWGGTLELNAIIVAREVLGPSATDVEVQVAANSVPTWLWQASHMPQVG